MNTILAPLRLFFGVTVLALGGCATLSESDCRQGNWSDIGYQDGLQGHAENRFAGHVQACAKYGVAPDQAAYFSARDEGLQQYCEPRHGFELGSAGAAYENVCPRTKPIGLLSILGLTDLEFEDAYALGREIYSARDDLNRVEAQIEDANQCLSKRDCPPEDKEKARRLRDELEHQRNNKQSELHRLEHRANRYF